MKVDMGNRERVERGVNREIGAKNDKSREIK